MNRSFFIGSTFNRRSPNFIGNLWQCLPLSVRNLEVVRHFRIINSSSPCSLPAISKLRELPRSTMIVGKTGYSFHIPGSILRHCLLETTVELFSLEFRVQRPHSTKKPEFVERLARKEVKELEVELVFVERHSG